MDAQDQESILKKLDELKENIEMEDQNESWNNGLLFYLNLIKGAFVSAPTNSTQGLENLATFFGQLVEMGVNMSLDMEIFSTIAKGIKMLY